MSVETILPPTYAEVSATLGDKSSFSSDVMTVAMQDDIVRYLKDDAQSHIVSDIKQLSSTIKWIEDAFADITHEMRTIDTKDIIFSKGKPVKFGPRWQELHDTYTTLMINSQKTARDVGAQIEVFIDDTIPLLTGTDCTVDDKKEFLGSYIETLKESELQAGNHAKGFLRLRQDIDSFRLTLNDVVSEEHKDVIKAIAEIDAKIQELQKALNTPKGLKKYLPKFLGGSNGGSKGSNEAEDIAAAASLAAVSPTVAKQTLDIVLRHLDSDLVAELQKQVKDEHDQSAQLLESARLVKGQLALLDTELKGILERLVDLKPTFEGMITKLTAIQGIWQRLLMDVGKVVLDFNFLQGNAKFKPVFYRKLGTLEAVYRALKYVLQEYSLSV